ncbi:MAG: type I restriction endonuclease [Candidatus Pacebacteria bacterium]|nr:type I restriction endonuclease [Candidatus Paceibacterota bacterium]
MARTPKDLAEIGFEEYIEDYLTNHGYIRGVSKDYSKNYAIDANLLMVFLEDTQAENIEKLRGIYKDQFEHKLLSRLSRELETRGMLDVIRHGIKDYGVYLDLAFFKPVSTLNKDQLELYDKNILSVTRQVYYSLKNENSIDMLISLNGLPLFVIELKNEFTQQSIRHAINQFRNDRDPNELLFQFKKRAIAFFAVDTTDAFMTTRLAKEKTFFLPFNLGCNGGKGNPDNPNGYKTAYFWEDILEKDNLLDILHHFIFVEKEEKTKKNGEKYFVEKVIFPRFHQLDVVRKVEKHTKQHGAGQSYLIQHSAGSGKTNSISWLTHRLAGIHNNNNNSIFSSIIVITDRKVLDKQLQDAIYQLEHKHGVVKKIDEDSTQLAEALKSGTKIIISTLQKFPFVLDKIGEMQNKNYAVVIDEAHSSTTGESMNAITETLAKSSLEEAEKKEAEIEEKEQDPNDKIADIIKKIGKQDNISFFAFTATPKSKTMEMFGSIGIDGRPHEFHLYSMRQAIEEDFIIDVLKNYVTYKTYYKIGKTIEDDPAFAKAKATKALARFFSLHPHNILQKTEIMVEHFRAVTSHKIGGKAKAMVVTGSRKHAVRYKIAFDKYIKDKGYSNIKTLVAFSGTVEDEGNSYTEPEMNKIKEKELPQKFASDDYQVLLVAEKYQTGFDQPLLHTMYVDKKLSGVKAVQTLSRLNRKCKGKDDTFVLDFVNDATVIQESFKPYFQETILEEVTEPNLVYDIETELQGFGVYIEEEILNFSKIYFKDQAYKKTGDRATLNHLVDLAINRFNDLSDEEQENFASKAVKFTRLYSFVIKITPLEDIYLHKMYVYLTYLIKKLPKGTCSGVNLDDDVSLDYYKIKEESSGSLSLNKDSDNPALTPVKFAGTGKKEDEEEALSTIIDKLNERFGTDFSPADQLSLEQIKEDFFANQGLVEKAKINSIDDFKLAYNKEFLNIVIDRMDQNQIFFTKILDDPQFQKAIMDYMLPETYKKLKSGS